MAFHCYWDQPCPACGHGYIRFAPAQRCPRCGSAEAEVYPLLDEILHYARLTLASQGDLEVRAFQPCTLADRYVVLGYELLEAYRHLGDLDEVVVADEAVAHYRLGLGADDAESAHWRDFFTALLAGWRETRHRPLDPLPASGSPAAPPGTPLSRPVASGTYRKKWSPKA